MSTEIAIFFTYSDRDLHQEVIRNGSSVLVLGLLPGALARRGIRFQTGGTKRVSVRTLARVRTRVHLGAIQRR